MITNDTSSGVSLSMIFQSAKIDAMTATNVQAILALLSQELANDGVFANTIERWDQARKLTHRHYETAFLTQIGGVK